MDRRIGEREKREIGGVEAVKRRRLTLGSKHTRKVIQELKAFRHGKRLKGLKIKGMIEEGRR